MVGFASPLQVALRPHGARASTGRRLQERTTDCRTSEPRPAEGRTTELRRATQGEGNAVLQREVAEALLLSALTEADAAAAAEAARERAIRSSQALTRFLANICHEMRAPLNAIGGYAQLMAEEIHGPITLKQRHDLDRILLAQEHLTVLITDVLNYARGSRIPAVQTAAVPVQAAVGHALDLLEGLAARKSIRFRNEVTDPAVLADADPDRLRQILINVVSNAIKFTPPEGTITMRCEASDELVRVSVTDTGVGIEPAKLEAIFEPFVQVHPSGEIADGVGLGLTISRDLAMAMRGDLTVESTPEAGSCFTLTLPRRAPIPPQPDAELPEHFSRHRERGFPAEVAEQ